MKARFYISIAVFSPFALNAWVALQKGDSMGAGVGLVIGLAAVAAVV